MGFSGIEAPEKFRRAIVRSALMSSAAFMLTSVSALAQTPNDTAADNVTDEIVTVGSRRPGRSPSDTPSPVDIVGAEQLTNQGGNNVIDLIGVIVPSFNVGVQPNSGTATSIRPTHLRGLSPDATLVLVNGKRRHRSAIVVTASSADGLVLGSQPPDISTIPAIALKRVEVLRDGASAQYGADAIAGVLNFVLRDDIGGTVEAKYGQYYEGDGDTVQVSAAYGLKLGDRGHLNLSAEFGDVKGTSRTVQQAAAQALIDAGNTAVASPVQIWGSPELSNDLKFFANLAVEAGDNAELYAFGGYAQRRTDGTFFWRNPNDRAGTFSANADPLGPNAGSRIRLVGDLTPGDGITCAGGIDFATGVRNEVVIGTPQDAAAIAAASADPNCFVFNELFPGGFTPFFGSDLNDISGTAGLRGTFDNGLTYDISIGAGRNEITFDLVDSINASLGPATPLFFKAGSNVQRENTINVNVSYPLEIKGLASPLNVAAGFEWREEEFQLVAGDAASFRAGILGNPDLSLGINQGFEARLNGFAPTRPEIAGKFQRNNYAFYLDLEADITKSLVLGAAVRFEDFSDFGTETTFKVSGLYRLTDDLTLRSTYATGFRAPTIGQQNFSAITTTFGPTGSLVSTGTVPPTSGPAILKGGGPLQPETSDSFTVGVGYQPDLFSLTVDYFNIKMDDRITLSKNQTITPAEAAQLEAAGFTSTGLSSFRFFTNDFSSTTQGVDVVLTVPFSIVDGGKTTFTAVGNWTKTEVTSFDPTDPNELLGPLQIAQLEKGLPKYRGNATINHYQGDWRGLIRVNYFGSFEEPHLNSLARIIDAGDRVTVDAELGFNVHENVELVLGAQNVFDSFPERNPFATATGAPYAITSPQGFNGGFYYGKVRVTF